MVESAEQIYGSMETATGLVSASAFCDEVTRHLTDEAERQQAVELVRAALAVQPKGQEFCLTSNEVGAALEQGGHLELAAQCYEWSFAQYESFANFGSPNLEAYGRNLVQVLQKISQQPQMTEQTRAFLAGKKGILTEVGAFLTYRKNYLISGFARTQLEQQGGIQWDGGPEQAAIMALQGTESVANALINLI